MVPTFDWEACIVMAFIALICFYQAYINLIKKRFTHFGLDALMVYINLKLAGNKRRKYVKAHTGDPERMRRIGITTLLFGIGFVWGVIEFWLERIQPHLKR